MKNDNKPLYSRVTLTTQYPDDYGPTISQVEIPVWDATIEDMFDAFEHALLAHGFHPDSIKEFYKEQYDAICESERLENERLVPDD